MPADDQQRKQPRKQAKAGEAAFEAIGWGEGPAFLDRDLLGFLALYYSNPQTNVAAFEALALIAEYWWDDSVNVERPDSNFGRAPLSSVPVPWWIVHLLGRSYTNYRNNPDKSAGEAFLLEGGGQGQRKAKTQIDQLLKEMRLALEIAHRHRQTANKKPRKSLDLIIQEVASEYGVAYDTAQSYWKKHGNRAKSAIKRNLPKKG